MMKKLMLLTLFLVVNVSPSWADNYRYISAANLKQKIDSRQELILLDIQVRDEFDRHHIEGAVATYAYPVKSESDTTRLEPLLEKARTTLQPVIIVCPRGGGGAKRAYDFLKGSGINEERLLILEGGQKKWPYPNLLAAS